MIHCNNPPFISPENGWSKNDHQKSVVNPFDGAKTRQPESS
jgi:hypothetical protein